MSGELLNVKIEKLGLNVYREIVDDGDTKEKNIKKKEIIIALGVNY